MPTWEPLIAEWGTRHVLLKRPGGSELCVLRDNSSKCEAIGVGRLGATGIAAMATHRAGDILLLASNEGWLYRLAPSGTTYDSVRLPIQGASVVPFGSDGIVVHALTGDPALAGLPLHAFDVDGRHLGSFDGDSAVVDPRRPFMLHRLIGPGKDAAVWSAHANEYVLRRFTQPGTEERVLKREADQYQPWMRQAEGEPWATRPSWQVRAVREDSRGLLWITLLVPDVNWRPDPAADRGPLLIDARDAQDLFDSVVEVIDIESAQLIASQRIPWILSGFSGDRQAYGLIEDAGAVESRVWTMRLTCGDGRVPLSTFPGGRNETAGN